MNFTNINVFNISQDNNSPPIDKLILIILAIAPIFSLTIRGWINGCVFLLAILCTYSLITKKNEGDKKPKYLIFLSIAILASNFSSVLIAQLFHTKFHLPSLDAPLRILLCIPIFLFLLKNKNNSVDLMKWSFPFTLIITFLYLHFIKDYYWGDRFATKFVDANALGSYTACFIGLTMLTIDSKVPRNFYDFFYWILWSSSIVFGFYIVIQAGTRGSFLVIPIIVFGFLKSLSLPTKTKFLFLGLIAFLLVFTIFSNSYFQGRVLSGYLEIYQWLNGNQTESSAGYRLSMFKLSTELFSLRPLAGYGEFGYKEALKYIAETNNYSDAVVQIMLAVGPHSTLFETTLNYGLIGLFGYLVLMFGPVYLFFKSGKSSKWRGLCFILSILVMGQSIHIFTLKYTSSLFGLLLAWLLSDALKEKRL
jgi:O-antigen ligase